jgi:hypothetical protein
MNRNETMKAMKAALEKRSGKRWSVTGGIGTAYGWLKITSPPARRTWGHRQVTPQTATARDTWEAYDTGEPGRGMSPTDRAELAKLLALDSVPDAGESIPSSNAYYEEFLARCEGRKPERLGEPHWD